MELLSAMSFEAIWPPLVLSFPLLLISLITWKKTNSSSLLNPPSHLLKYLKVTVMPLSHKPLAILSTKTFLIRQLERRPVLLQVHFVLRSLILCLQHILIKLLGLFTQFEFKKMNSRFKIIVVYMSNVFDWCFDVMKCFSLSMK